MTQPVAKSLKKYSISKNKKAEKIKEKKTKGANIKKWYTVYEILYRHTTDWRISCPKEPGCRTFTVWNICCVSPWSLPTKNQASDSLKRAKKVNKNSGLNKNDELRGQPTTNERSGWERRRRVTKHATDGWIDPDAPADRHKVAQRKAFMARLERSSWVRCIAIAKAA